MSSHISSAVFKYLMLFALQIGQTLVQGILHERSTRKSPGCNSRYLRMFPTFSLVIFFSMYLNRGSFCASGALSRATSFAFGYYLNSISVNAFPIAPYPSSPILCGIFIALENFYFGLCLNK